MRYYDEETLKKLKSYQFQIVASFFVIIAILISISVIKDLYNQTLSGQTTSSRRVVQKSLISNIILLIVAFYFVYITFNAYLKDRNKNNFYFMIAAELGAIAVILRYISIKNGTVQNEADII